MICFTLIFFFMSFLFNLKYNTYCIFLSYTAIFSFLHIILFSISYLWLELKLKIKWIPCIARLETIVKNIQLNYTDFVVLLWKIKLHSGDGDEHHASCAGNGFSIVDARLQCFGVEAKITESKASQARDSWSFTSLLLWQYSKNEDPFASSSVSTNHSSQW